MAVLRAYLDESGTDQSSEWITMAGWVSSQQRWKPLSAAWAKLIRDAGVTEAHAKWMQARRRDFHGWPPQKVNLFRYRLCQLIERHVRFGVVISVLRADYEQGIVPLLPPINEHPFGAFRDPYIWLMATAVGLTLESGHLRKGERVAFMFDEGHEGEAKAAEFFYWMLDSDPKVSRHVVRKFSTGDSIQFPPLQAADQLAWGCNRGTRFDIPAGCTSVQMRGIMNTTLPVIGGTLNIDGLRQAASRMGSRGAPWRPRGKPASLVRHAGDWLHPAALSRR